MPTSTVSSNRQHRYLSLLLVVSLCILLVLVGSSLIVERNTHTPLARIGETAPNFQLPSTAGQMQTLKALRGHPVVLAFVPSVRCDLCQQQLLALQAIFPKLQLQGIAVFVISTDEAASQQAIAANLHLSYPLLAEAPTLGQHPAGTAYGVYHLAASPVDANALFVIDAQGSIRAVQVQPEQVISSNEILTLVDRSLSAQRRKGISR